MGDNLDRETVDSFGDEWTHFDQDALGDQELQQAFNRYFSLFPWPALTEAVGFDMGCGSGRWARLVAPRVGRLRCIEPSSAVEVAQRTLADCPNVSCERGSIDRNSLVPGSQDFGYSLGVLHHTPNPAAAMASCVALLKPGAPFLIYMYYAFDNRGLAFRALWRCSDLLRKVISRLPGTAKRALTDCIAVLVYWPLSRAAALLERLGVPVSRIPLSYYRSASLYTLRTDSRDRFGTPVEWRFTRDEIRDMMEGAGLEEVRFSDTEPYWCAVGFKTASSRSTTAGPTASSE